MKTMSIYFSIFAITLCSLVAFANDGQYVATMQKNIQGIYQAKTIDEFKTHINAFQRIADAEKTKWEPYYYAAFGYVMIATREASAEQKDLNLDLALESLEKASALKKDESEIVALQGFVHMIRVTVDPGSRGPQFAGLAMQTFESAIKLNPENPRAYAMLGQMQFGTAQFFGSPTTEACATLKNAIVKFDTFKSENPLAPQWGRKMAEGMIQNCK